MPVLVFHPFVRTEQRYFLCNLRWYKIYLVITERLNNRTSVGGIFNQLLQFLFFRMEFIGFVFKFGVIFRNLFQYLGLS